VVGPPRLPRLPRLVVTVAVPETGAPVSDRRAVIVRTEGSVPPTSRTAGDAETVMFTLAAGGTGVVGGAVGEFGSSVEQPARRTTPRASAAVRIRVRAFIWALS
jgi:hypothetical protein